MKLSTIISSLLIAIIATLSPHPIHAEEGHNLRFLKPDKFKCTADCNCFAGNGVRGESTAPTVATCKIFVGNGAPKDECQSRCVSSNEEAEKLIANGEATVSVLIVCSLL